MRNRFLTLCVFLSIFAHLFLMGVAQFWKSNSENNIAQNMQEIELITTPPNEKPLENKQIIQMEKSVNKEYPDHAKFVSKENQKVEKETVAQNFGKFQNIHTHPNFAPKKINLEQVFKNYGATEAWEKQKEIANEEPDQPQPTTASQTDDKIDNNVDKGLETLLNAQEFKYYSYHNRIREKLSQYWQNLVRKKLAKMLQMGRYPASTGRDRTTSLVIILNDKGTLVGVKILGNSGLTDLDDAAVEAFRAAAPFPNPPKGMVDSEGTIKIRWDFVLES